MIIDSQNNCVIVPEDNFCIKGSIYNDGIIINYETDINSVADKKYNEGKYKLEFDLLEALLKYKQKKEREKENAAL